MTAYILATIQSGGTERTRPKHGDVLQRQGAPRAWRWRFGVRMAWRGARRGSLLAQRGTRSSESGFAYASAVPRRTTTARETAHWYRRSSGSATPTATAAPSDGAKTDVAGRVRSGDSARGIVVIITRRRDATALRTTACGLPSSSPTRLVHQRVRARWILAFCRRTTRVTNTRRHVTSG